MKKKMIKRRNKDKKHWNWQTLCEC